MLKHNNVVPKGVFKKHLQNYVKTWFNQPTRKTRKRAAGQKKAMKIFPRANVGSLRPIVHGKTLKYNMKAAGIPKKLAPTIGIVVDYRWRDGSVEGYQANAQSRRRLAAATRVKSFCLLITQEIPTFEFVEPTKEMKVGYAKIRDEMTMRSTLVPNGRELQRRRKKKRSDEVSFLLKVEVESSIWDFVVSLLGNFYGHF
ncbi:hypothetical protein ACHQM5_026525 [Ranunculus cassubicifolius]